MRTITVEATAHTAAPPSIVWDTVADARTWPTWSIQDEAWLEREGSPSADGLGAIRHFRTGKIHVHEEVVRFDAPHHFGYKLLSGLPVKGYVAHIDLGRGRLGHHDHVGCHLPLQDPGARLAAAAQAAGGHGDERRPPRRPRRQGRRALTAR